jgi:hypothetical protein
LGLNRPGPWSPGTASLKGFQSFDKIGIVGHPSLNKADLAALVNQIGHSSAAIDFFDLFARVRHKRKLDAFFVDEFHEGFHVVSADANDLCIRFTKFFQITLEVDEFVPSDRCEYGEIERQNDVLLSVVGLQGYLSLGGIAAECRRFVTDVKAKRDGRQTDYGQCSECCKH